MFPFGDNPLEPSLKRPSFQLYDQIQNPIISKHDESPFFSNFPSPFFDEHELPLNQIFPNFHSKPATALIPTLASDHPKKISDPPKPKQKTTHQARRSLAVPRKRTGKKDRHSKICTAQGIRDRRMRLSLQVARKFFDLQDLLGYDKASKTIEWLFSKSKKAIKELGNNVSISVSDGKSESFVSECEVVSGIEENCSNNEVNEGLDAEEDDGNDRGERKPPKVAACKPNTNTRETREKARARARCRTEEKMMGKRVESSPNRNNVLQKLGSSLFDGDDRERVSAYGAAPDYAPLVHPPSDAGTIEKLLGSSSSDHYNCSAAVIDPTTSFMGFIGNWDLLSNDRLNYAGNPNSIYSPTTPDFPLFHQ